MHVVFSLYAHCATRWKTVDTKYPHSVGLHSLLAESAAFRSLQAASVLFVVAPSDVLMLLTGCFACYRLHLGRL